MSGYRPYYPTSLPHIGETMDGYALAVYAAVCHHAQSSKECTAGMPRLARLSGFSVDTVRRTLRKLSDAGHLTLIKQPGRPYKIIVVGWRAKESTPLAHSNGTPSPQQGHPSLTARTPLAHSNGTPSPQPHEQRGVTTKSNNEEERRSTRVKNPTPEMVTHLKRMQCVVQGAGKTWEATKVVEALHSVAGEGLVLADVVDAALREFDAGKAKHSASGLLAHIINEKAKALAQQKMEATPKPKAPWYTRVLNAIDKRKQQGRTPERVADAWRNTPETRECLQGAHKLAYAANYEKATAMVVAYCTELQAQEATNVA